MYGSLVRTFVKISDSLCSRNLCTNISNRLLISSTLTQSYLISDRRTIVDYKRKTPEDNRNTIQPYIYFKFLRLIKGAIREFGPIIEENKQLAYFIKKAEEHNVPFDFIDYARRISVDIRAKTGIYELLYLNQGIVIAQYEDADSSNTRHHVLKICNKYDAYLISGQSKWNSYFMPKGMLSVREDESQLFKDKKEAEEVASKIGAQSVMKEIDLDGLAYWQFQCEPEKLQEVKKGLKENNYQLDEAFVGFVPQQKVTIPMTSRRLAHSIIIDLSKIPEIDNVYTNITL